MYFIRWRQYLFQGVREDCLCTIGEFRVLVTRISIFHHRSNLHSEQVTKTAFNVLDRFSDSEQETLESSMI